jgi:hypothetical protein
LAVAATLAALTACSPTADLAPASQDVDQPLDELLDTAGTTAHRLQGIADVISAQGLVPFDASGSWATCSQDEHSWQYVAVGQLLSPDGPSAEALPRVTQALQETTTWTPASPATPHSGDRVRVNGRLGGGELALNAATDAPDLTVLVLGTCLPVRSDEEEAVPEGTDSIDIGQRAQTTAPND